MEKMKKYGLLLFTVYFEFIFSEPVPRNLSQCDSAKSIYSQAGFTADDIFSMEQSVDLKVCHPSKTCCKEKAESNLVNLSESQRKKLTNPHQQKMYRTFHDSEKKFGGMFRKMISQSQTDLDKMFEKTYGPRYSENTYIFKELYTSLNQYFNGSELLLTDKVDNFFGELHKKMYVMTKPFGQFTKNYQTCIYDNTNYARPFGDTQRKIAHQTSRSFMASRVFMKGLREGMDVISELLNLPVGDECSIAFMKMTQCSICYGVSSDIVRPCMSYCKNVMKGCFTYIIMVQGKWDDYISGMVSLAEKLEGPFSMEAVVAPLGVKISEAIMTFQDNLGNITEKIEEKCGKAPSNMVGLNNRRRRSISGATDDLLKKVGESEDLLSKFKTDTQKIINGINTESSNSLSYLYQKRKKASEFELLVQATKSSLSELKDLWIALPNKVCEGGLASPGDDSCWNGQNTTRYSKKVVGDSKDELFKNNPEMTFESTPIPASIIQQYRKLEGLAKRLNVALSGETIVQPIDNEVGSGESGDGEDKIETGSGSGDGESGESGKGPFETTTSPTIETSTVDNCVNSVEGCPGDIKTPTDVSDNLPFIKPVKNPNSAAITNLGSWNGLLLSVCVLLTNFLL